MTRVTHPVLVTHNPFDPFPHALIRNMNTNWMLHLKDPTILTPAYLELEHEMDRVFDVLTYVLSVRVHFERRGWAVY